MIGVWNRRIKNKGLNVIFRYSERFIVLENNPFQPDKYLIATATLNNHFVIY